MDACLCVTDSSAESDSSDDSDIEGEATSALFMVSRFESSVQFPCFFLGFCFFRVFKCSRFLSFRRSAPRLNVEVGVVPRAAPGPAVARGRRPSTLPPPPIRSELLPASWNKVLESSLKPVN